MKDEKRTERMRESQKKDTDTRRREGAMRLFSALSGVDEAYLAACESESGRKVSVFPGFGGFVRRYGGVFAAALFLAVLGVGYVTLRTAPRDQYADDTASMGGRSMALQENAAAWPEAAEPEAGAGDLDETLTLAQAPDKTDAIDGQGERDGVADMMKEAGTECLRSDSLQSANGFGADEADRYVEEKELTLEQAGALAVVGAYLPDVWPAQGEITCLVGDDTAGAERISMTWSYANQRDTFFLSVENLGTNLPSYIKEALADKEKPETYDENLYEIPYAETVPKAYWTVFQDPVFEEEIFDKDCVRARLLSHPADSSDTATPRGVFRILYRTGDSYVLLRFSGRGTVDEIWDLLSSVGDR